MANLEYGRPAWSQDSGSIFFSGGPPEQFQVYRISRTGGEPVEVLKRQGCGNVAVNWRTRRMAYNFLRPGVALEIWTSDLDGSSPQQITKEGFKALPEWSPDGSKMSFLSFPDQTASIVDLKTGVIEKLGPSLSPPVWCPKGERLGFIEGRQDFGTYQLALRSRADGSQKRLQSTLVTNVPLNMFDKMQFFFDWSGDGKTVVWPVLAQGQVRLALVDVDTDRLLRILPTHGWASEPRFSPDGRWIAYSSEATGHARGIRIISLEGTDDHELTRQKEFVKGQLIYYPSAGGLQIPSFLFRPPPADNKAKKPAIIWLHGGGGIGAALDEFDPAVQYFVANGFVVLQPNFRTSRGFGPELVTGVTGKDIVADVIAGADYLKTIEDVDRARIALFGASFGGYAVLRTITSYPNAFVAAVDISGPCDLAALYHEIPNSRPILTTQLGGSPEQAADRYREESPIHLANRIGISLLVIHGTADETVPYRQSQLLVDALRKAGNPCKLVTYKGVGHGFRGEVWANAMQNSIVFLSEQLNLRRPASRL